MTALSRWAFALMVATFTATTAFAAPVINNRVSPVSVMPGPEVPMQDFLNNLVTTGAPDALLGQSNIASFRPTEATIFTFLEGYAGYRGSNIFGIYEVAFRAERDVFAGYVPNGTERSGAFSSSARSTDFGWFLDVEANGGYRLHSDDSLNPAGLPHSIVYIGNGQSFVDPSLGADGVFHAHDIIIAFEDLRRWLPGRSDDDFNDLIVLVENVNWQITNPDFTVSLPEPGSLLVWGSVVGVGLVAWRKRRRAG